MTTDALPPAALPVITFTEDLTLHLNNDDIHVVHVPPDAQRAEHHLGAGPRRQRVDLLGDAAGQVALGARDPAAGDVEAERRVAVHQLGQHAAQRRRGAPGPEQRVAPAQVHRGGAGRPDHLLVSKPAANRRRRCLPGRGGVV